MWFQRVFHFCGARLKNIDQICMTAFKIVEHFAQLLRGSLGIEPNHPANDMIGSNLIGGVEVSGFSCRFERSDDDPCRIRTQI